MCCRGWAVWRKTSDCGAFVELKFDQTYPIPINEACVSRETLKKCLDEREGWDLLGRGLFT